MWKAEQAPVKTEVPEDVPQARKERMAPLARETRTMIAESQRLMEES
ncbi:hypothetical protein [Roseomonas sp. BN140053]